jgi:hypothetical protein
VDFSMMAATQWDCELIADFAAKRTRLRKSQMMGVRRPAAADQARLLGNQFNVIAVANPVQRRQREDTLIYTSGSPPLSALNRRREPRPSFLRHGLILCRISHKIR